MSLAFPSPGHQLTIPGGGGTQVGVDVGVGVGVDVGVGVGVGVRVGVGVGVGVGGGGVAVGVGVGTGLHLPALPALTIAWISVISSARLKSSNSSIKPFQSSAGTTTFLPM